MAIQRRGNSIPKGDSRSQAFKDLQKFQNKGLKTREDILANLGIETPKPLVLQYKGPNRIEPVVYKAPPPKKGGGGFLGALGDVIKFIDKPRAVIVSSIKETGDLLSGEGFSATDWWNQVGDNMMMGEVLRDWGVDLPGPLDFALGIGLDIALDPLTYLTGGAVAARYANPKRVADALGEASKVYKAAGNFKKSDMLIKAQGRVLSKGSILSAGDEALKEVGMGVGIGFTMPGTGRLSRSIIERPLRKLSPRTGRYLDGRRVAQLPEANLPQALKGKNNPWSITNDRAFDLSKAGNQQNVVTKMSTIRANKAAKATAMSGPARQAMRMPVQTKFFIPGSANFVRVSSGLFGTAFSAAAATKIGRTVGQSLGTQADYNQAVRSLGKEMAKGDQDALEAYDYLRVAYRSANTSNAEVVKWQHYTVEDLKDLRVEADKLGVEFDQLMYNAAQEPYQVAAQGAGINPRVSSIVGETAEGQMLHQKAQGFWDEAGKRIQQQLEPYGIKFDLVDFEDEFYVPRYLDAKVADDVLDDFVHVNMDLGESNTAPLAGQMGRARMYATPKKLARLREKAVKDPARNAGLIPMDDSITDAMVIKAARANNVDIKTSFGTPRPPQEIFEELINLPTGVKFTYADTSAFTNNTVSNRWMGSRLDDVAQSGSVRQQMDDIGISQRGDDYKSIFASAEDTADVQSIMQRYINQTSSMMRENMFLASLNNAGVTVNIGAADKAAKLISKGKQVPFFGRTKNQINQRFEKLISPSGNLGKQLSKAEAKLAREEALLARYSARQAEFEAAVEGKVSGVSAMARTEAEQFSRLNSQVVEAERQIDEIQSFMHALLDPEATSMPDLSRDVFEMLRPPSAKASSGERLFTEALIDGKKALQSKEQAALIINDIATNVNSLTRLRETIVDALNAIDGQSVTAAQFKKLLDDLDEAVIAGKASTQSLSLNWVDNAMKDPSVQSANLFKRLTDEVVKDTAWKITRNGRKLSTVTFVSPIQRELKNLTSRMRTAARLAAKRGDSAAEASILKQAKNIDNWTDRVGEIRKLQAKLGEDRLYSGTLRGIKSLEEGVVKIRELSGITVIDDQINEIEQLIRNTSGINDLDGASQEMLTDLIGQRQRLIDINEPNIAALNDVVSEWERKMANLNAKAQSKQIDVNTLKREVDIANEQKGNLLTRINNEIEMGTKRGTLSDRLSYIDDQQIAVRELNKARSQNTLSDAYGGALNDYIVNVTPITTRGPKGKPRPLGAKASRALEGKAFVGSFSEDTVELMTNAMVALGKLQDPTELSKFFKGYDKFLNWWKAQAVTSPGFFMRNQLGGMWINNQINEVPMYMHARVREIRKIASAKGKKNILTGLNTLIDEGKSLQLKGPIRRLGGSQTVDIEELRIFRDWFETGVAGQGQVSQEITTTLDQLGAVRGGAWKQGSRNPFDPSFKPMNWIRARNSDSEFMLRGALAHHNMMVGDTLEDAIVAVRKYHFDYSDLSDFERKIKKVIPFWVWQRNILPVLVESIGKNPKAWGRLQQVKEELELTSPMENMVPHYFGENMGIRLPFTKSGNRVYVMPDLPFRDMQKITKEMESVLDAKGLVKGTGRLALESAMPPMKLPIELMMGKQVFGGIPFSDRYQQAPIWANAPGIREALLVTGLAKKSKDGTIVMTDKNIYSVDQFLPIVGRIRRLIPNERAKQDAALTTWMNTFLGTGLRVNTPATKRSELIRRQREAQKMLQDKIDIEMRMR
tara:strand:+ start:141 stop:5342 length:5202 start_codon:yes stop_codon:yes gene_type:complete